MSLQHRQKAIEIIESAIKKASEYSLIVEPRACASAILNRLLKAGYLDDKVIVHASETKDELDQAIFKCKIDESKVEE